MCQRHVLVAKWDLGKSTSHYLRYRLSNNSNEYTGKGATELPGSRRPPAIKYFEYLNNTELIKQLPEPPPERNDK